MEDLQGVVGSIRERLVDGPRELALGGSGCARESMRCTAYALWGALTGQSDNLVEVEVLAPAENEGSGRVIGRRVSDLVCLSRLDVLGVVVDLRLSSDDSNQGCGEKSLEETHLGG